MANIEIKVTGADVNAKRLETLAERGQRVKPVWETLEASLIDNEQSIWNRNGGGGKRKWEPLSEAYAATKGNNLIGRRTGALEASVTTKGGQGQIDKKDNDSFTWGTSVWYGVFMQGNKRTEERGFPQRQFFFLTLKTRRDIKETIADYIMGEG